MPSRLWWHISEGEVFLTVRVQINPSVPPSFLRQGNKCLWDLNGRFWMALGTSRWLRMCRFGCPGNVCMPSSQQGWLVSCHQQGARLMDPGGSPSSGRVVARIHLQDTGPRRTCSNTASALPWHGTWRPTPAWHWLWRGTAPGSLPPQPRCAGTAWGLLSVVNEITPVCPPCRLWHLEGRSSSQRVTQSPAQFVICWTDGSHLLYKQILAAG